MLISGNSDPSCPKRSSPRTGRSSSSNPRGGRLIPAALLRRNARRPSRAPGHERAYRRCAASSSPPWPGSGDVTEIILNLKGLVVSEGGRAGHHVRPQAGPRCRHGADIVPPAGVTVHNPDLHIATLNDKGKLEIELVVERGRAATCRPCRTRPPAPRSAVSRSTPDLRAGPQGDLQGGGHLRRAAHRLRPPGAGRGDQELDHPERRPSRRRARRWSSCSAWRASSTSRPGHRDRPSPVEADHMASFNLPIEDLG